MCGGAHVSVCVWERGGGIENVCMSVTAMKNAQDGWTNQFNLARYKAWDAACSVWTENPEKYAAVVHQELVIYEIFI